MSDRPWWVWFTRCPAAFGRSHDNLGEPHDYWKHFWRFACSRCGRLYGRTPRKERLAYVRQQRDEEAR